MYLSAERLALANQTVKETFEQCSIAWQSIPHWETGDPGQTRVPLGNPDENPPTFPPLTPETEDFQLTLVRANAPVPDMLLAEVIEQTVKLAQTVDGIVLPALYGKNPATNLAGGNPTQILAGLIGARAQVEDAGYRAPACLFTDTAGLIEISALVSGLPQLGPVLAGASVNSIQRTSTIDPNPADNKGRFLILGRRQLIPHGGAPQASPGEEPVDLAVSVPPSLEVVGEGQDGEIEVSVRITFALRIKDAHALVALIEP